MNKTFVDAITSAVVAVWCILAIIALTHHEWDRATAMFAGAILMRTFVSR